MSTIDDLVVGIGIDDSGLDAQAEKAASTFEKNIGRIGLAAAAAGAGLETFARGQQDTNIQTQQLAASLGISQDAMRDLARETANVGFPLEEVLDIMETGKQQGLESADALKTYAEFWDMVGDGSGENATELAKAGVALHSMGIAAGDEAEALGALGFIQDKTTLSQADFLGVLGKLGPDLTKAGLSIDDTAAFLGILSNEMGLTGKAARTELAGALKDADSFDEVAKNLGITTDMYAKYSGAVVESSGVMERNAEIVDQNFTPLQKLQNEAKELMFQYGDLAQAAGTAAPILMAIGPAAKVASSGFDLMGKGIKGIGAAIKANPIGMIITALTVLVGILVYAYNHSETFRKIVDGALRAVGAAATWLWENAFKPAFEAIGAVVMWLWRNVILPAWNGIKIAFQVLASVVAWWWTNVIQKYFKMVASIVTWLVDRVRASIATWKAIFSAIGSVISSWVTKAKEYFTKVVDFVKGIPGKIKSGMSALGSAISAPFRSAFNFIADAWNNTVGRLSFTIPSWIPGIGGNSWSAPRLPHFHDGGIVPGPRGAEVLGVLQGGERVLPLGSEDGGGTITIRSDGSGFADLVVQTIANAVRNFGPGAIGIKAQVA